MCENDSSMKKLFVKCEKELCYVSCNLPLTRNKKNETRKPSKFRSQDGPYAWFVCFSAVLSLVITMGLPSSFGVIFPVLLDNFKESKAKTAWVGSLNMSFPYLLGPIAAILCNRFGCRVMVISGALVTALGLLMTSQAPSILVMYFTYGVVCSFGACCVYTGCYVIAPRYFWKRRSLATSVLSTGLSLATLTFGPLLQTLIERLNWRNSFFVLAAMNCVVCVLALSFHSNIEDTDTQQPKTELVRGATEELRRVHGLQWEVLKNKKFVIYCVFSLIACLGLYNTSVYIVQFAAQKGISRTKSSMLYFYFGLMSTLARILSGILLNMKLIDCPSLCIIAVFINGIAVLFLALTNNFAEILTIFFVLGVTDGAFSCAIILLILHSVKPSEFAFAYGLWLFCLAFALILGPVTSGLLVDTFQSYNPVFYASGGVILLSTLILGFSFLPCVKSGHTSAKQQLDLSVWDKYTIVERISVV